MIEQGVWWIKTLVRIDEIHDLSQCEEAYSKRKLPVRKGEPMCFEKCEMQQKEIDVLETA